MRQVVITADLEDGGWVVEVPSLPGCISQGDTQEAALANILDAIQTWISGATAVGLPISKERFETHVCAVQAG